VVDGASAGDVLIERAVDYGQGKLADVYWPQSDTPAPLVLLWHGIGVERDVLEPLATAVSRLGVAVVVPDWESEAVDGGRAHLLASVEFTQGLARARPAELATSSDGAFVLAGWSRGGKMAASLALNPEAAGGWRPSAVVCLASGYVKGPAMSPIGNGPLADLTGPTDLTDPTGPKPIALHLVHGARDTVVSIQQSRDFVAAAAIRGWPADLAETDTDHAGIVMAEYDESTRRCRPTTAPHAITAGLLAARTIANAAETVASAPAIARDAGR
jgi:alpha-beta hydrolase superfamily lysophospholipase